MLRKKRYYRPASRASGDSCEAVDISPCEPLWRREFGDARVYALGIQIDERLSAPEFPAHSFETGRETRVGSLAKAVVRGLFNCRWPDRLKFLVSIRGQRDA